MNLQHEQLNLAGKKILFANFPADGHFNPLTSLAVHLQQLGCDVRWYTSVKYAEKIRQMDILHYPFQKALDVSDVHNAFPERDRIKGKIAKLSFDIINAFILRAPEYYADIEDIYQKFPFDIMISDCAFTVIPFVKDKLNVPVISIGVLPLTETSVDLPPSGLGMTPSGSFFGKVKQRILRYVAEKVLFRKPNQVMRQLLESHGIDSLGVGIFDLLIRKSSLLLQSGTPGFEYKRSDMSSNIRFIGSLLPYTTKKYATQWFDSRLNEYEKVVVVTQGTVERDIEKLLVPTLEAFQNSDTLVVATTGGSGTDELRKRFPAANLIIEDFIPFADIMPYADAYITNGGYGGVMLGIEHHLPLVVAGVHEGKNEINARIGYFQLGINLKTEKPTPAQLRAATAEVIGNAVYKKNVIALAQEFSGYNPQELTAYYVKDVLLKESRTEKIKREARVV